MELSDYGDKGSGIINTYGYGLSTSSTCSGASYIESNELSMEFSDTYELDTKYYGCIKLTDNNGNIRYIVSGGINYQPGEEFNEVYSQTSSGEYTYVIPQTGIYKLEVWGAQGGGNDPIYIGGYGGYSTGNITLEKNTTIYVVVGGMGNITSGGYNGGGTSGSSTYSGGGGGGATHIATSSGLLSTFSSKKDEILIVAGGGGGGVKGDNNYSSGGGGGGYIGNSAISSTSIYKNPTGGTQSSGGSKGNNGSNGVFGIGGNGSSWSGGGGGGLYGGGGGYGTGGGGGSGYIGNSLLTDKYMYCYNCTKSDEESTRTYTTDNFSEKSISEYAKKGNGAAKISIQFVNNINTVNVNYDNNNGTGCYGKSVTTGESYGTLCTPIRSGYTFDGWWTSIDGGTQVTSDTIVTSETNHTIYAHWIEATSPVITFETNGNGGYTKEGVSSRIIVTKGDSTLDTKTFKYTFSKDSNAEPTNSFINGNAYSLNEGEGIYYLIAEACDVDGECTKKVSEPFYLDTVAPTASLSLSSSRNMVTVNVSANDNGSGVLKYGYLIQTNDVCPMTGYIESNNASYTFNLPNKGEYYVCVKIYDNVNNTSTTFNSIYLDLPLNGAEPVLDEGMIPITFDVSGDNTIIKTVSEDNSSWYDYDNKEWANAILVTESSRSKYLNATNVEVNQSDILAYFVWIPRYKYKIWTLQEGSTGQEQEIEIIFQPSSEISEGSQVGEYITHPAFWWDNDSDGVREDGEELSGIWVGKFETTGSAATPTILPDTTMLITDQNIYEQFKTSLKFSGGTLSGSNVTFSGSSTYGLTTSADSHIIKNSEWGAVSYLSHSKYGVNREVYINNGCYLVTGASKFYFYSGRSGGNVSGSTPINGTYPNQSSTIQYNTYGFYTWDGYLLNYNTNDKSSIRDMTKVASTTGNITGVYDMSGGAGDHVMGNYNNVIAESGFNVLPSKKYYDLYTSTNILEACNGEICFGHALSETKNWYGDYMSFVTSSTPWFYRGLACNDVDGRVGIFSMASNSGGYGMADSFRVALILL